MNSKSKHTAIINLAYYLLFQIIITIYYIITIVISAWRSLTKNNPIRVTDKNLTLKIIER